MFTRIARADVVGLPELLYFIRPRHRMVLTTFRRDGSLQSSPVTGGVDAEGRIVVASYPQRAKSANIRRRPEASVVVMSDDFGDSYVQVDGAADVIDLPDALRSAGRVLPLHLRRTPGLGRLPPRDGRSGQVPAAGHPATLGTDRRRRLPTDVTGGVAIR